MTRTTSILVLVTAAGLEAGGDALVRLGLLSGALATRFAAFAAGAILLFAYGWTVNAPPWNFGQLLGLYVVFFFLIAQALSWLLFRQPPPLGLLLGGCLIVAGGLVIALTTP